MALQYFTGFEDGTTIGLEEINAGYSNVTTAPRSGARHMSCPGTTTKTGTTLSAGDAEVYTVVPLDPDTAVAWTDGGVNGAEVALEVV